jgi:hypothetical protein
VEDDVLLNFVLWKTNLATTIAQAGVWTAGSYTFDPDDNINHTSYVETSDGADPDVPETRVAADAFSAIKITGSFITVENFLLKYAWQNGVEANDADDTIIVNQ